MWLKWTLLFIITTFITAAQTTKSTYTGDARDSSGTLVYREKHDALFSKEGAVLEVTTDYLLPDGEKIGTLYSDFKKQLATPEHIFKDLRDGSSYGLEIKDEKYILWRQEKGKDKKNPQPREEKEINRSDFSKDTLIVTSQGLHYYIVANLDRLKEKKESAIKYLIPGKLDYYSFTLKLTKETDDALYFTVGIDSFVLRMFMSDIDLKYNKKDRHLISYSGLSNLSDADGKPMSVNLEYTYE